MQQSKGADSPSSSNINSPPSSRPAAARKPLNAYRIPSQLADFDLHLFGEGRHWHIYRVMGAHLHEVEDIPAPCLPSGRPMRAASVWWATSMAGTAAPIPCAHGETVASGSCSCPAVSAGALYKYEVQGRGR